MRSERKTSLRISSFIISLILVFSVISLPEISVKADGSAGTLDDFVERCYTVTLDRPSDSPGFADWKDQLLNGKAVGIEIAYGFLFSREYLAKNKDNDAYLKDLYMLFMGREPDESGYNDWMGKLNSGVSRLEVFGGFANSQEFYNICESYGITAGRYVMGYDRKTINNVNLYVERMYKICLGRIGDKDGQKNWVEILIKKEISGSECARSFIFSKEYINLGLSDEEFVENLYLAMFGRHSDADGKNNWLYGLKNGMTRDEVFAGFANSVEFDNICKTYGIDRGTYTATDKGTFDKDNPNNIPVTPENPTPAHTHKYNKKNIDSKYLKSAATCTKAAVYYYSCECGEKDTSKTFTSGNPKGHKYNKKNTDSKYLKSAATCTSKAVYYYSCECGKYDTNKTFSSGKVLAHNYNKENTDSKYLKSSATCTSKAIYYYSCECGKIDTSKTFTSGDSLGHDWDDGIVTIQATEEVEGEKLYTCKREGCNETKTENIPKLSHSHCYNQEKVDSTYLKKAATCTEDAEYYYSCRCGDYDNNISFTLDNTALGHEWDEGVVTIEPTEESEGEKSFTCTRDGCNVTKTESIPKKEHVHTYNQKNTDSKYLKKAATCKEAAVYYYSCKCGDNDSTNTFIYGDPLGHDLEDFPTTQEEATLTCEGKEYYSCKRDGCNETITKIIPSLLSEAQVGDIIQFGKYEQDGDFSNGAEYVEWEIISKEEGRVLVISKNILDNKEFNDVEDDNVTWETSSLRFWLNNDFLNAVFSEDEKKYIPTVGLENKDDAYSGISGGNDTKDRVFFLSIEEIERYIGFNWYFSEDPISGLSQKLVSTPTQYAIDNGASYSILYDFDYTKYNYTSDIIGCKAGWWWLRDPGRRAGCFSFVECRGSVGGNSQGAVYDYGVRPAMYIEFQQSPSNINEYFNNIEHTHLYNKKNPNIKYRKTEATCESSAVYFYSCECGEFDCSETFTSGDPLGHYWDNGTVIKESTLTMDGEMLYKCLRYPECTSKKMKTIPCLCTVIKNSDVGDTFKFGLYEQDNKESNGKEPIEWQILDIKGDKALVVSKYVLDAQKYNETKEDVTWETSSLRSWLNNDFYNQAFNSEEKELISMELIENKKNPHYYYNVPGGNSTYDNVFCLSIEEVEKYFGEFSWFDSNIHKGYNLNLLCTCTSYAQNYIANYEITEDDYYTYYNLSQYGYSPDVIGLRGTKWWLRSPGLKSICACEVDRFGNLRGDSTLTVSSVNGVRPALYIKFQ